VNADGLTERRLMHESTSRTTDGTSAPGAPHAAGPVTEWLTRWRAGNRAALEHLVPLVYDELRQAARRQLRRESPRHTLSPTALVHETYLRLLGQQQLAATDRQSLLAVAGHTMRRILVDHARSRMRRRTGHVDRREPEQQSGRGAHDPGAARGSGAGLS
jgi:RNA polymerase sigma factor (TIGR02999 family)